ncbi:MAG: substrate-binding domain-containing protein [Sneathiellaceae bacterium]
MAAVSATGEGKAARGRPLRVGLLAPLSGPIGLFGPSSVTCADLAAAEINAAGGILGRPIELVTGDAGGSPAAVVAAAEAMLADGVEALLGSHVSPSRIALVEALAGRVPYIYTTLYEGGTYAFGVFVCGETPEMQLEPLLAWLARNKGVRRWHLVGNDYVFPRRSLALARRYIAAADGSIAGEALLPLGSEDFGACLDSIAGSGADAVLIYLVGTDSILFNRQFGARGLHRQIVRAAPVLCENALLGIGAGAARNLYSATGYANASTDTAGTAFRSRYAGRFGRTAPVPNRFGIACHDGLHLLAGLAARAGSLDLFRLQLAAEGTVVEGPRGRCTLAGNHLGTPLQIALADGPDLRALAPLGYRAAAAPPRAIWPADRGTA